MFWVALPFLMACLLLIVVALALFVYWEDERTLGAPAAVFESERSEEERKGAKKEA